MELKSDILNRLVDYYGAEALEMFIEKMNVEDVNNILIEMDIDLDNHLKEMEKEGQGDRDFEAWRDSRD